MFEGHYFGELALIFDEPRNASVRAIGTVNCMYISKEVSTHAYTNNVHTISASIHSIDTAYSSFTCSAAQSCRYCISTPSKHSEVQTVRLYSVCVCCS
jgi:hypothetical protein